MYNLILPLFLLLWPPVLLMLPVFGGIPGGALLLAVVFGNLLVDWLVTALALRWQKIPNVRKKSLAVLIRVWLAGFAADFLCGLLLIIIMFVTLAGNIYESAYALAVTLAAVLIGGWLIYCFNINWALEPAELTEPQRKRTALALAVLTAPWLFLVPTEWFYYI